MIARVRGTRLKSDERLLCDEMCLSKGQSV